MGIVKFCRLLLAMNVNRLTATAGWSSIRLSRRTFPDLTADMVKAETV